MTTGFAAGVPLVDFSPLSDLGRQIGSGIRDRRALDALSQHMSNQGSVQRTPMNLSALAPEQTVQTPQAPQADLQTALEQKASDFRQFLGKVRGAESGGDVNARNPRSTATGDFQFTEGTWADLMRRHPELGLTPDGRTDPRQTQKAAIVFTRENEEALRRAGTPITDTSRYAAHFLGAGVAPQVMAASDETPMSQLVPQNYIEANPFLANMDAGGFRAFAAQKMGEQPGQQAIQSATSAPQGAPQRAQMPDAALFRRMVASPLTRPFALDIFRRVQAGQGDQFIQRQLDDGTLVQYNAQTGEMDILRNPQGSGEPTFGKSPVYMRDPQTGELALGVVGDDGSFRRLDTQGLEVAPGIMKVDTGTGTALVDKRLGDVQGNIDKDIRGAEVEKAVGAAQGEEIAGQAQSIQTAQNMVNLIDAAIAHPGRAKVTGASGIINAPFGQAFPGTDAADYMAIQRQLEGKAFLQAFDSLKGGGQITEVEGRKATEAIGRLSTAQSDEAYLEALNELKGIAQTALTRGQQGSTVTPQPATPALSQPVEIDGYTIEQVE
jgi:hypothetical protein